MAEKVEQDESLSAQQGKAATDFKNGSEPSLTSSEAQKNQEVGSTGTTPDQAPMQRSNIHKEDSRMADKGKQKDPDLVAKDEPANHSETVFDKSSEKTEEKNTYQGGAREGTSVESLASSSSSPARVIPLVEETRRVVNDALKNVDMFENMKKGEGLRETKSGRVKKFLKSSTNLFRHIYRMLQNSNPDKKKFSVLIVTHYDNYIRLLKNILPKTGDWDVQEVETGEAAIESHSDGKSFDLIILLDDLVGLDGPRVTKWFRDNDVKTLIVGLTAFDVGSPEREAFKKTGLNFCLKKPVAIAQELESAVSDYIRVRVNRLSSIVSDLQRIIGKGHDGSSSSGRKKRKHTD